MAFYRQMLYSVVHTISYFKRIHVWQLLKRETVVRMSHWGYRSSPTYCLCEKQILEGKEIEGITYNLFIRKGVFFAHLGQNG